MADINVVALSGRMVRDVIQKQTTGGTSLIEGAIALGTWNKSKGEEESNFFDFVMFGDHTAKLAQYLTKGSPVMVSGMLRQERWQNQEGENRSKVKVIAQNIRLTGSRGNGGESEGPSRASREESGGDGELGIDSFQDDIPF